MIVQSTFRVLCFHRQLSVVFCLLVGAVLTLLLHVTVVEAYRLTWWLSRIRFALFVVEVKESVFLSCALEDGKELLAEVLLLILGLRIRIISSLFLSLEPLLRTSILHPLAYEVNLVISPFGLGLLLCSLLVLFFRLSFFNFLLPKSLLRLLYSIFKVSDSMRIKLNRFFIFFFFAFCICLVFWRPLKFGI